VKKVAAILFLLTYGFTTIGTTVHIHYCMNKFAGASLWHSNNSKCGKCGMKEDEKKKGCCKDEHKQVKLKAEHQKAAMAQYIQLLDVPALPAPFTELSSKRKALSLTYSISNAPKKIPIERLYILDCVFLI
jgi:hypothetical protein